MDINDYIDLNKVSIADFYVAIYQTEKEIKNCLKNKNVRGFLVALKLNLKLNKLLCKRVILVEKQNNVRKKQL